jgi:DNA-binding transcriptional LysR family regulator
MIKNLSHFIAFDAVARHLSFAKAARELGLAPSSVAKSISKLESRIAVKLFNRTTRSVRLTQEGLALHQQCAQVLADIQALDQLADATSSHVQGVLRVSAPIGYGSKVIMPVVSRLLERHSELRIDLRLSDDRVDIVSLGLDAAIRFGQLADSNLVSRPLERQPLMLCASSRYLQHHPLPDAPEDLDGHTIIGFRMPGSGRNRPLEFTVRGEVIKALIEPRLQVNQGAAMLDALLTDCGMGQLPLFMVQSLLATGELVELLPAYRPPTLDVTLLTPAGRPMQPRLEVFLDALKAALRPDQN